MTCKDCNLSMKTIKEDIRTNLEIAFKELGENCLKLRHCDICKHLDKLCFDGPDLAEKGNRKAYINALMIAMGLESEKG